MSCSLRILAVKGEVNCWMKGLIGVIPCSSSSVLILLLESASIPEALRDLFV